MDVFCAFAAARAEILLQTSQCCLLAIVYAVKVYNVQVVVAFVVIVSAIHCFSPSTMLALQYKVLVAADCLSPKLSILHISFLFRSDLVGFSPASMLHAQAPALAVVGW